MQRKQDNSQATSSSFTYRRIESRQNYLLTENQVQNSILFNWFTSTLKTGYSHRLALSDLHQLPEAFKSSHQNETLFLDYINEEYIKQYTLLSENKSTPITKSDDQILNNKYKIFVGTLLYQNLNTFLLLGILKLCSTICSFSGPIFIGLMVTYIADPSSALVIFNYTITGPIPDHTSQILIGISLVIALTLGLLLSAVFNTLYNMRGMVIQMKIRALLTKSLFAQALKLRLFEWKELNLNEAKLTTHIQVDAECVANCFKSLHDLWNLPLQLIIAFILLYLQVKIGFLAGLAVIIVLIPINSSIAKSINTATQSMMTYKDARVRVVTEAVRGMKSLKMLHLEQFVLSQSYTERAFEVYYLSKRKYLDAVCVFLWASTPILVPLITFVTTVLLGTTLSPAQVFTTLALLNMLIFPMNAFPWVINGIIEARVSAKRLAAVLIIDRKLSDGKVELMIRESRRSDDEVIDASYMDPVATSDSLFVLNNAEWMYVSKDIDNITTSVDGQIGEDSLVTKRSNEKESDLRQPLLTSASFFSSMQGQFRVGPLTYRFNRGRMYAVTGSVGSGKSSFLLALLNELTLINGQYNNSGSNLLSGNSGNQVAFSYCAQIPSLHAGTVKDNILMGAVFDEKRYKSVIIGCQLLADTKV